MAKPVKVYKPTDEEIFKNVVQSFEIENIRIAHATARTIFKKVQNKIKKENG